MLVALFIVFTENAVRTVRRDRTAAADSRELDQRLNAEIQRVHELIDQVRNVEGVQRERAVRQAHPELTRLHRVVVGSEPPK